MKSTGMARKIDALGRLVLPAEIRRRFGLRPGTEVEIQVDGDRIVLTKADHRCVFCESPDQLRSFRGRHVCASCAGQLSAPPLEP